MSTAPAVDKSAIRDAASVILLRRREGVASVLMGMRGAGAAFMPSKYVFPGGAVDPEDAAVDLAGPIPDQRSLEAEPRTSARLGANQLAACALRELVEETGLMIGPAGQSALPGYCEAGRVPDPGGLRFIFRAITPPGRPRRFDARFFLIDAAQITGDPDDFSGACDELSHLHWVPLNEARALNLPFITEVVLAEISAIAAASGADTLNLPPAIPFFDNREEPRFVQIPRACDGA